MKRLKFPDFMKYGNPDVLRYYCEVGRVCPREELATAFEQSELLLKKQPPQ
jgi:hypothetical protein